MIVTAYASSPVIMHEFQGMDFNVFPVPSSSLLAVMGIYLNKSWGFNIGGYEEFCLLEYYAE